MGGVWVQYGYGTGAVSKGTDAFGSWPTDILLLLTLLVLLMQGPVITTEKHFRYTQLILSPVLTW